MLRVSPGVTLNVLLPLPRKSMHIFILLDVLKEYAPFIFEHYTSPKITLFLLPKSLYLTFYFKPMSMKNVHNLLGQGEYLTKNVICDKMSV